VIVSILLWEETAIKAGV